MARTYHNVDVYKRQMVESGMRQHGQALRIKDKPDRLFRRYFFTGDKIFAPVAHVAVEGFGHAFDIAVFQKISGIMASCYHGIRKGGGEFFIGNINARFLQVGAHFLVPQDPGIHEGLDFPAEFRIIIIDKKPQDMNCLLYTSRCV